MHGTHTKDLSQTSVPEDCKNVPTDDRNIANETENVSTGPSSSSKICGRYAELYPLQRATSSGCLAIDFKQDGGESELGRATRRLKTSLNDQKMKLSFLQQKRNDLGEKLAQMKKEVIIKDADHYIQETMRKTTDEDQKTQNRSLDQGNLR